MVPKTIEWLLMSLVAYKGDFAFLRLFGVNSGSVQSVLASYGFFRVEPFFKSDDFTECFDSQIYNKSTLCQSFLQNGSALMYYKVGQILLQSGKPFCITDRASGITKCYRYCKVELFLSQSGAGITKLGNIYLQSGTIITKLDRTWVIYCVSSH